MGANAQTSVPTFTAGEILTAANMNISARTGIPVFADATARDAAFGGTGEKTLAEGQFAYLESTNATQYYDGSAWQSVGSSGLTLISATTISAAATTNVNDVFSTTYDNYKVFFNGTASTGTDVPVTLKLRVSGADATTNYTYQRLVTTSTTTVVDRDVFGTDEFGVVGINGNAYYGFDITMINPFNASPTKFIATSVGSNPAGVTQNFVQGVNTNSTSYTGFSLLTSGSISGTLKIYGLAN
jgi:hypothetical protein